VTIENADAGRRAAIAPVEFRSVDETPKFAAEAVLS
jgi:hypothetical protein